MYDHTTASGMSEYGMTERDHTPGLPQPHVPVPAPRPRRPHTRPALACAALLATTALLSGCGGDSDDASSAEAAGAKSSASPSSSKSMDDMDGMDGMNMGDPSATPAYELPDTTLVEGSFKLLDTRPPGLDDVKGTAWLAQGAKGTTVTVKLTGLKPGASYMSHLHAQQCSAENGGDHFQFEKGGSTMPPNEVHLAFKADKTGMGMTTVNNDRKTGENARAIVIHPAEAQDNRIACADFEF
ncbi:superoxide dismutase family protein [Streptomyces sp. M41]|uniref:superoxide dismutase family protein n=1 Tax=Streptomyces sp. M41 TaxID=3059412 RepID=UPI00374CBA46